MNLNFEIFVQEAIQRLKGNQKLLLTFSKAKYVPTVRILHNKGGWMIEGYGVWFYAEQEAYRDIDTARAL